MARVAVTWPWGTTQHTDADCWITDDPDRLDLTDTDAERVATEMRRLAVGATVTIEPSPEPTP
jgi:hypothetical protein